MPLLSKLALTLFLSNLFLSTNSTSHFQPAIAINLNPYAHIADIPTPDGFRRMSAENKSFANWLRQFPLKKDKTVFLYNGQRKQNQAAQFAVLDLPTGSKDLQQCADAVIRLRAEYLFSQQKFSEIDFTDNNAKHYRLQPGANRTAFDKYLENVFAYCGTASLEKQLNAVTSFDKIAPGDVLIKGGSPGHAMQVMDVAVNNAGKKIYLLAQSHMPAQDMHVVINPRHPENPWYEADDLAAVNTPEWVFRKPCLKKW
ncbi:MAG: DUF4846 domain-containing protein [Chitinophagaceae bacterium]